MPTVRVDYQSQHAVVVSGMRAIRREAKLTRPAIDALTNSISAKAKQATTRRGQSPAAREAKAAERAYARANQAAEKHRLQVKRTQDKELRDLERKLSREAAMERRARAKSLSEDKKAANAKTRVLARQRRVNMRRLGGAGRGVLGIAAVIGGAALGLGGAIARKSVLLDDYARKVAIKGGDPSQATSLRRSFEDTAVDVRGSKALDIGHASAAFVSKTGDLESAKKFQTLFAEASLAADASAEDIGAAAAAAFDAFDIKTLDDMRKGMATFIVQGKRNAFELSDLAEKMPKLAAAGRAFGLESNVDSLATLTGFTQIAMKGTGNADTAATGVTRTLSGLTKNAQSLQRKYGIDTDSGDLVGILSQTIAKVGGTNSKKKKAGLLKLFGEQGIKAVNPLITAYFDAVKKGTDGADAVAKMMRKASDASDAEAEVRRDLVAAQKGTGAQLTAAWEQLTATVGPRLIPVVAQLAEHLGSFIANTNFTPLITVVDAVVYSLGLLVDFLKESGLIKERTKTPQERERLAQRAGDNAYSQREAILGKARRGEKLSYRDMTKLHSLNAEVERQAKLEQGARDEQYARPENLTGESFRAKLASQGFQPQAADYIAKQIETNPIQGTGERLRDFFDDTDQNKQLIQQYGTQLTHERASKGEMVDTKPVVNGVAELAGALKPAPIQNAVDELVAALKKGAGDVNKTNSLAVAMAP